jgi:peptidoglycan/LPS O-acetylase OafA/YrhL
MPNTTDSLEPASYPEMPASPAVPKSLRTSHIPGLDGIRGIAVLLVFMSHTELGVPGRFGPLGVTIFFFLSGYLITTLLQREFDRSGAISLKDFYLRRVLRIVPPMLITISIVTAISVVRGQDGPTVGTFLIQAFSLTNYFMIVTHYLHGIPFMQPMWSLSVEEHFYLVYPFLFATLYRNAEPKRLVVAIGIIAAVVAGIRCWDVWQVRALWHDPVGETYIFKNIELATHTRVDSIIYGCLFALVANPMRGSAFAQKINNVPSAFAGVLILLAGISVHYVQESIGYILLGVAFVPLFTATILQSKSGWLRFLESAPMRYMGAISYTFYLIHVYLLMSLKPYIHSHIACAGIALGCSLAFSTAMLYLVERPLARVRSRIAHA